MDDKLTAVTMVVPTRDVFVARPDIYNRDFPFTPVERDTYEDAYADGLAMLARAPWLKRFRIEKWTERTEDAWVDNVENYEFPQEDASGVAGGEG